MRGAIVWYEAARHRVRDDKGMLLIVVEMADDGHGEVALGRPREGSGASFYFLLDGQDVRRSSEDTFVNLATGEILRQAV